ncbi:MAG: hypothetical protein ACREA0_03680 [bacterium]
MILGDVMQEVADELDSIPGLHVFAYPADNVVPPAAVVGYPREYLFDVTASRGTDIVTLPVWVLVGKVHDRTTRDTISDYVSGSGAKSFKAVIQTKPHTAFGSARVTRVVFETVAVAGTDYLAGIFDVMIHGTGD